MALNNSPRSQAFVEYLSNRKSVIDLLRSAPPDSEQLISAKQRKLASTIYCSCVVLLTSYLERYVESLIIEAIDAINAANIVSQTIPEKLRVAQIKEHLYELRVELQKDMTLSNVTGIVRKWHLLANDYAWLLDETQPFSSLSGEPLIGENRFSNPTPAKIDELFRHLGISNLVGHAVGLETKPDRAATRDKVGEMVEKRNNIAHTGATVTVTDQDVKSYLVYSRRLTRAIDILIGQEVQKLTAGIWPWA